MKVSLLGTGVYGLAIASAIAKNGHDVYMWTEKEEIKKEFAKTHNLESILPDYKVPKNISVSNDMDIVLENTEAIIITCASRFVDNLTKNIAKYYHKNIPICIASKGIDEQKRELLSTVVYKNLHTKKICVISGPTFAIDMIHNEPVALAIASLDHKSHNFIKEILANDTLKLRKSTDIIGIQICGSVKNIIAIASGILGGLGYSESTQAFLINESLHDIKNLIYFLKGKPKTILSFAGVGDLLMTSMSKKSRNYSFGYLIGSTKDHKKVDDFLKNNTVEGYFTLKTVIKLLNEKHIKIDLIYLINEIIDGKKDPHDLANFLINKK